MNAETSGPMSRVPQRVGGRYRLESKLGRGGMAAVYRGHDEQLDRPVAVKLMRGELGDDPTMLRRFEVEARRAASVAHPNLVAVYDVGVEDGVPYIVMELVEGGDLAVALEAERPMSAERASRIGVDVAAALEVAHRAGLVHRDIKPGNILLDRDGGARVTDFGIARATGDESLTRTGAILGSVDYFSPEQARGERATSSSDLYGLGAVLYELLTGTRPFSGDTPYAVATARLRAPAPDVRAVNPRVPQPLAAIVQRAMARNPHERFSSAAELRVALESWLADATAPAGASATEELRTASSQPGTPSRTRQRRRWALVAAPIAAVALALIGWLGGNLLTGGDGSTSPLDIIVGQPGGEALLATESPAPSPTLAATPAPPLEDRAPIPTSTPDVARPPEPASTVPAPTPEATPVAVALADTPADAVSTFYRSVADGDFDAAHALWSQRMKDTYPRQGNLDDRFADTASITFTQLEVVEQTSSEATVQANFIERYDGGGSREFIGYWRLIRSGEAWLLNEPTY